LQGAVFDFVRQKAGDCAQTDEVGVTLSAVIPLGERENEVEGWRDEHGLDTAHIL
jgi:hypothetical protein